MSGRPPVIERADDSFRLRTRVAPRFRSGDATRVRFGFRAASEDPANIGSMLRASSTSRCSPPHSITPAVAASVRRISVSGSLRLARWLRQPQLVPPRAESHSVIDPFVVGSEYRDSTEILHDQGVGVVGVKLETKVLAWRWASVFAGGMDHLEIDTGWSPEVGSIPSGGEHLTSIPFGLPPGVSELELGKAESAGGGEPNYVLWYVETQFADITGAIWTARFKEPFAAAARPQRVRTRSIEFWRPTGADA